MSTRIVVREATAADAPAIAELLGQLGYPATEQAVRARMARMARLDSNVVLVAEADGAVVGLATGLVRDHIQRDEPSCRIASMVVDERWRGRGIGTQLVEAIESWGRAHGATLFEVTSGTHRPDAHRFYERLGYVEKPKRFIKETPR